MSADKDIRGIALRRLSTRERTEKEMRGFLEGYSYSEDKIVDTLNFLKEYGYIDDDRYSRHYYVYARSKSKALYTILRELKQKGIDSGRAKAAIEDLRDDAGFEGEIIDDRSVALEAGRKMANNQKNSGKALDEKFMARVGRRLMSLGYSSSICYFVIRQLRRDESENV